MKNSYLRICPLPKTYTIIIGMLLIPQWVWAASGKIGSCYWSLAGGTLTISGNGSMGNDPTASKDWDDAVDITTIHTIRIKSEVSSASFRGFYYKNLEKVYIEDGTEPLDINNDAFNGTNVKEVYLGRNLSYNAYTSFIMDNGYYGPFQNVSSITELTISNFVTEVHDYCFDGCSGLTKVTFPFNFDWRKSELNCVWELKFVVGLETFL